MSVRRLVYIANVRLPTEKAHGFQIAKMCEALADEGTSLTLFHPRRRHHDPALGRASIAEYYGVRPTFAVRALPNLDIVPLSRFMPARAFVPVFFIHAFAWGLFAARIAAREHADAYFTRDLPVAYWLVRRGLPTLWEAHAVPRHAQRHLLARIARRPVLRSVIALTSCIGRELLRIGVPAGKLRVLPDGVDLAMFRDLPDRDACRQRLGLPVERAIVGYVGRFQALETEKGIPDLIPAMAELNGRDAVEPLLLCVGGPMAVVPAYLAIARMAGITEDRLRFVDRVPNREVPYWIRACDVVTIPSPATEHFAYFSSPLKLFEYMAAGVPIVATDLPAIREVLRDGENALLTPPGDPDALKQALRRMLADRTHATACARQAHRDVQRYTWSRRAGQILGACALPSEGP